MVRIVSDSSTMYSPAAAKERGFDEAPLSVTIAGSTYKELAEIDAATFVGIIGEGHMPTSSQPAIGDMLALYDSIPAEDDIITISMADGLSGTYASAVAAAGMSANSERITVVNTRTLCGPHRHMVETAVDLAKAGADKQTVLHALDALMQTDISFLMPADFDYLRRGGRLSPLVSYVGRAIKLAPVLTQSADGRQLTMAGVKRSFTQAISFVCGQLKTHGVADGWRIYITHAEDADKAEAARAILAETFPAAIIEVHPLTPVFITQGGPSCVAVQAVRPLQ